MWEKRKLWKRILAYLLTLSMMSQPMVTLAAEAVRALKPGEDILVQWLPAEDAVMPGEEGTVVLHAELKKNSKAAASARVEISLTRQEADMLTEYANRGPWSEDESHTASDSNSDAASSSNSRRAGDGSGEQEHDAWLYGKDGRMLPVYVISDTDEEVRLGFDLGKERYKLEANLHFYAFHSPEAGISAIDVTEEDILVTAEAPEEDETGTESPSDADREEGSPASSSNAGRVSGLRVRSGSDSTPDEDGETGEPVIVIETKPLVITKGEFDWEAELTAESGGDEDFEFRLTASPVWREEPDPAATPGDAQRSDLEASKGYWYTKSQTFQVEIKLPEMYEFPEGTASAAATGDGYTIRLGQIIAAELTGLSSGVQVTDMERTDARTLCLTLTRDGDPDPHPETGLEYELENLDCGIRVILSALHQVKKPEGSTPLTGQVSGTVSMNSVSWGELEETEEPAEAEIPVTLSPEPQEQKKIVVKEKNGKVSQDLYWVDQNNRDGLRPGDELSADDLGNLTFKMYEIDEDGNRIYAGGPYNTSEAEKLVGTGSGDLALNVTPGEENSSPYVLSASELPTKVEYTYGEAYPGEEPAETKTYEVEWILNPKEPSAEENDDCLNGNYDLVAVTEEDIEQGTYTGIRKTGWYYVQRRKVEFDVILRAGTSGLLQEDLLEEILSMMGMHVSVNGNNWAYLLKDMSTLHLNAEVTPGNPAAHVVISGAWKYTLNGNEMSYWITESDGTGVEDKKLTKEELEGLEIAGKMEDGDYLRILYDNSRVPSYGSVTDRLYPGGSLNLTLGGIVDYHARKVWLDGGNKEGRPEAQLQLWRYRASEGYQTAAPVRENGEVVTITLDSDQDTVEIDGTLRAILGELPKYDTEGHRFIYVFRESLIYGSGDNQYEQVFGEVKEDTDGTFITEDTVLVWSEEEGQVEISHESSDRAGGNTYLYNGGTLSNRIRGSVDTQVTKTWDAAALQAGFSDVKAEFTLQCRSKAEDGEEPGEWKDAEDDSGSKITVSMEGFIAEALTQTVSRSSDRYDQQGRELEYRWTETGVYQKDSEGNYGSNLLTGKPDGTGTFTLIQDGIKRTYTAETEEDPEEEGHTRIINRLMDTISYRVTKKWLDDSGTEYVPDPSEGKNAVFDLYRIISGKSLEPGAKPYASFTLNGIAEEAWTTEPASDGTELRIRENPAWHMEVENLPEFTDNGYEYEYLLLERNHVPKYEIEWIEEERAYEATVTNGPGQGYLILLRKEWVDDNDTLHRQPVTVAVYDQNEKELTRTTLGEGGVWQETVGIPVDPASDGIYIRELDKDDNPIEPERNLITDNHQYQVTYDGPDPVGEGAGSLFMYTVRNRRLGSVDLTVTKTWQDGGAGQGYRQQLQEAVEQYNADHEEEKLSLVIGLAFADSQKADEKGYKITYEGTDETDTVSVGGSPVEILGSDEATRSSEQAVEFGSTAGESQKIMFFGLPKYDADGQVVRYTVKEYWLLETGTGRTIYSTAGLKNDVNLHNVYELAKEYSVAFGEEIYVVDQADHTRDTQTLEITNRLTGTKDVLWHKQWEDSYNHEENLRPDIYLNVYSVSHKENDDGSIGTQVSQVMKNYRWQNSALSDPDEDIYDPLYSKDRHWHAVLEDMPKYDSLGYEIIYYAVERTSVDAAAFDYQDVQYGVPKDGSGDFAVPGSGSDASGGVVRVGTASGGRDDSYQTDETVKDWLLELSGSGEGGQAGENVYALAEDGTFYNRIQKHVVIDGEKVWENLPAGYDEKELPSVTLHVTRYVQADDLNEDQAEDGKVWDENSETGDHRVVASLELSRWEQLEKNGDYRYRFTISYAGKNNLTFDSEGNPVFYGPSGETGKETDPKLERYDDQGRLYVYVLEEVQIGDGDKDNIFDEIYKPGTPVSDDYILRNIYKQNQEASLSYVKYLYLPGTHTDGEFAPSGYPSVKFGLYRTFQKSSGTVSDEERVSINYWKAEDIKSQFENGHKDNVKDNLIRYEIRESGLAVYAPNGSPYTYYVKELKEDLQGYDTWVDGKELKLTQVNDYIGKPDHMPQDETDHAVKSEGKYLEKNSGTFMASFINKQPEPEKRETVEIKGTKEWDDWNNRFNLRPEDGTIPLILWRSAASQPGQNNGINKEVVSPEQIDITWNTEPGEENQWSYIIKGTEDSPLERYAPNGMPWDYQVEEGHLTYNGVVIAQPPNYIQKESVAVVSSTKNEESHTWTIQMTPLENTLKTSKPFQKEWTDESGHSITEDYLGYGVQVEFKLQVYANAQGSTAEWKDAAEYFNGTIFDDVFGDGYLFTRTIPENGYAYMTDACWKKGGTFENLPNAVKSGDGEVTLSYRVVESKISYKTGGPNEIANAVEINLTLLGNSYEGKGTYTYNVSTLQNFLFQPGYHQGNRNDENTVIHRNILNTTSFEVQKTWNDDGNAYGTRPTDGKNDSWTSYFLVQRRPAGSTDEAAWENVVKHEPGGSGSPSPLIVRITGSSSENSQTITVPGLPEGFEYRALEIEPGKDGKGYADINVSGNVKEDEKRYYESAYEVAYADAIADGSGTAAAPYTATNTLETTRIYGKKIWQGTDRPTTVTLKLQYKKTVNENSWTDLKSVTLNGAEDTGSDPLWHEYEDETYNAWYAVWDKVPEYFPGSYRGEDGTQPTQYRVVEVVPGGYIQISSGTGWKTDSGVNYPEYSFTNVKTVTMTVTKQWAAETSDQKEVTAGLWRTTGTIPAEGTAEAEMVKQPDSGAYPTESTTVPGEQYTVRLNSANNWKQTIGNLPKYDGTGKAYTYFARELTVDDQPVGDAIDAKQILSVSHTDGMAADGNSFSTEILNIGFTDLPGTKTWKDNENAYRTRPDLGDLVLTLMRRTGSNAWSAVPAAESGQPQWNPDSSDASVWNYTYSHLAYADAYGNPYSYQVEETVPEIADGAGVGADTKYEASYDGAHTAITNTLTGTTQVSVTKQWTDGSNADGLRPQSLRLTLLANGVEMQTHDLTGTGNTWSYTFENLPRYDGDGKEISYTVEETVPDGYDSRISGPETAESGVKNLSVELTNTLTTQVAVRKVWGGVEESRRGDIVAGLYRTVGSLEPVPVMDGTVQRTITLTAAGGWKGTFDDLPRFDENGSRYRYSVKELTVGGVPAEDTGFQIRVTEEPQAADAGQPAYRISNVLPTRIQGTKTWEDDGDAEGLRPEILELLLYRSTSSNASHMDAEDGAVWVKVTDEDMNREGIRLVWDKGKGDVWTYTYENLPSADNEGSLYAYDVLERSPSGYVLTGSSVNAGGGRDFVNRVSNGDFSFSGTKTWDDGNYEHRPDSVTLKLYRSVEGEEEEYVPAEPVWTGTGGDVWTYTYSGLAEFDADGRKYIYRVEEAGVPSGYDVSYDGLNLVNRRRGSLKVTKTVTGSGANKERPFRFNITLLDTEIDGTLQKAEDVNGKFGDMEFTAGTASFTLKDGQWLEASGLRAGMQYMVVEEDAGKDGYRTQTKGAAGVIPAGKTAEASFVNSRSSSGSGGDSGGSPDPGRPADPGEGTSGPDPVPQWPAIPETGNTGVPGTVPEKTEKSDGSVRTGDTSGLFLYTSVFLASAAGLLLLLLKKRRNRDGET